MSTTSNNTSPAVSVHVQPSKLIDALPYVDLEILHERYAQQVKQAIQDELKMFAPREDYLSHLPQAPTLEFPSHPFLQHLLSRQQEDSAKDQSLMCVYLLLLLLFSCQELLFIPFLFCFTDLQVMCLQCSLKQSKT